MRLGFCSRNRPFHDMSYCVTLDGSGALRFTQLSRIIRYARKETEEVSLCQGLQLPRNCTRRSNRELTTKISQSPSLLRSFLLKQQKKKSCTAPDAPSNSERITSFNQCTPFSAPHISIFRNDQAIISSNLRGSLIADLLFDEPSSLLKLWFLFEAGFVARHQKNC